MCDLSSPPSLFDCVQRTRLPPRRREVPPVRVVPRFQSPRSRPRFRVVGPLSPPLPPRLLPLSARASRVLRCAAAVASARARVACASPAPSALGLPRQPRLRRAAFLFSQIAIASRCNSDPRFSSGSQERAHGTPPLEPLHLTSACSTPLRRTPQTCSASNASSPPSDAAGSPSELVEPSSSRSLSEFYWVPSPIATPLSSSASHSSTVSSSSSSISHPRNCTFASLHPSALGRARFASGAPSSLLE